MARVAFRTRPRGAQGARQPIAAYTFQGMKVVEVIDEATREAVASVAADAKKYWDDVVWGGSLPNETHPYAQGGERDHGHFVTTETGSHRFGLMGYVNLDAEYPLYVEFGTANQEAQMPLRRTMDWASPQIAGRLRALARAKLRESTI